MGEQISEEEKAYLKEEFSIKTALKEEWKKVGFGENGGEEFFYGDQGIPQEMPRSPRNFHNLDKSSGFSRSR